VISPLLANIYLTHVARRGWGLQEGSVNDLWRRLIAGDFQVVLGPRPSSADSGSPDNINRARAALDHRRRALEAAGLHVLFVVNSVCLDSHWAPWLKRIASGQPGKRGDWRYLGDLKEGLAVLAGLRQVVDARIPGLSPGGSASRLRQRDTSLVRDASLGFGLGLGRAALLGVPFRSQDCRGRARPHPTRRRPHRGRFQDGEQPPASFLSPIRGRGPPHPSPSAPRRRRPRGEISVTGSDGVLMIDPHRVLCALSRAIAVSRRCRVRNNTDRKL
jgi:hypothetical protein